MEATEVAIATTMVVLAVGTEAPILVVEASIVVAVASGEVTAEAASPEARWTRAVTSKEEEAQASTEVAAASEKTVASEEVGAAETGTIMGSEVDRETTSEDRDAVATGAKASETVEVAAVPRGTISMTRMKTWVAKTFPSPWVRSVATTASRTTGGAPQRKSLCRLRAKMIPGVLQARSPRRSVAGAMTRARFLNPTEQASVRLSQRQEKLLVMYGDQAVSRRKRRLILGVSLQRVLAEIANGTLLL